jgi:hypothetical protein
MIYIDQIAELAAESIKAAYLTPLPARESAPSSHCEAGPRQHAISGDDGSDGLMVDSHLGQRWNGKPPDRGC